MLETTTIDRLFLELSQVTQARTHRELLLTEALESANQMCRSAMSIAERKGEANWEAFRDRLKESLELQHRVMYPENYR